MYEYLLACLYVCNAIAIISTYMYIYREEYVCSYVIHTIYTYYMSTYTYEYPFKFVCLIFFRAFLIASCYDDCYDYHSNLKLA